MPQGSLISPLLFIGKQLKDFGYADDLLFYTGNLYNLTTAIKSADNWCQDHNMKLNRNKCGILKISKKATKITYIDK